MTRLFTLRPARPDDRDAILECLRPWNMHHVPSPEMEQVELDRFFVAELSGRVVGAAGYTFAQLRCTIPLPAAPAPVARSRLLQVQPCGSW